MIPKINRRFVVYSGRLNSNSPLVLSSWLLLILGLLLVQMGCYREVDRGVSAYGTSLTIVISGIQEVEEVAYSAGDQHYVLKPKNPLNRFIVANVVVANNRSARTSMYVDETAAYFSDDKRNDFLLVDPYIYRENVISASEFENRYVPFLWGNIELLENYQIEGWMVFESPPDPELTSFYWEQADPIRVALK